MRVQYIVISFFIIKSFILTNPAQSLTISILFMNIQSDFRVSNAIDFNKNMASNTINWAKASNLEASSQPWQGREKVKLKMAFNEIWALFGRGLFDFEINNNKKIRCLFGFGKLNLKFEASGWESLEASGVQNILSQWHFKLGFLTVPIFEFNEDFLKISWKIIVCLAKFWNEEFLFFMQEQFLVSTHFFCPSTTVVKLN